MVRLPSHLLQTYRKYKQKENEFLIWIYDAARKSKYCPVKKNDPTSSTPAKNVPHVAPKLKGKARKLANEAKKAEAKIEKDIDADSNCPSAQISLFDITGPARAVASSKQIKEVPKHIMNALHTVLTLREQCAAWYRGNTSQLDKETLQSNKSHEYPIALLRQVIDILGRKCVSNAELTDIPKTPSNSEVTVNQPESMHRSGRVPFTDTLSLSTFNKFKGLSDHVDQYTHVAEPQTQVTQIDSRLTLTDAVDSSDISQAERAQNDFMLARFCLLEDMQELEDYIVLELVRYSLDQANADTLSFVMNTAVDLVLNMESSLQAQFADFEHCEKTFWDTILRDRESILKLSPIFRMQAVLAKQDKPVIHEHRFAIFRSSEGKIRFSHPSDDYFEATPEQQWKVEQEFWNYIRMRFLPARKGLGIFAVDMTTKFIADSLNKLLDKDTCVRVGIGAAFAIRLGLLADMIFQMMGVMATKVLDDSIDFIKTELSAFNLFWNSASERSNQVDRMWRSSRSYFEGQEYANRTYEEAMNIEAVRKLLEFSPLLSSLNTCVIHMNYAIHCVVFMENAQIVQPIAHLFNLLKKDGLIRSSWPDLDQLESKISEDFFFQCKRAHLDRITDSDDLRDRILWSLGLSKKVVNNLMSGHVLPHKVLFPKRIHVAYESHLYYLLSARPFGDSLSFTNIIQSTELILAARLIPKVLGREPKRVGWEGLSRNLANKEDLLKLIKNKTRLQPSHFLTAVKLSLEDEFRIANFNYLVFQKRCSTLIEMLYTAANQLKGTRWADHGSSDENPKNTLIKTVCLMIDFVKCNSPGKQKLYAKVFETWLSKHGQAGQVGQLEPPQKPSVSYYPLRTKPDLVRYVQRIVERRGLVAGTFTSEQLYGLNIPEHKIKSFENILRENYRF